MDLGTLYTRMGVDTSDLKKAEGQFTRFTGTATNSLKRVTSTVFSLKGALAGMGIGLLARSFLGVSREMENIGVRMKFLTGSTKEAGVAVKLLQDYAAQVPFEFEEISKASPTLLTVAKDTKELGLLLQMTGDIAAVTGLDFETTAQQIQRAFSAGISSADLFRERAVGSMLGFAQGATLSAAETKKKFMEQWTGSGGITTFMKGAAEALATTWDGTVSMIQDKWMFFRKALMDAGPFEFLKAGMQEVEARLTANFGTMEEAARQFGDALVRYIQAAVLKSAAIMDLMAPPLSFIIGAIETASRTFSDMPAWMQSVGVVGAVMFGVKGTALLVTGLALVEKIRQAASTVPELSSMEGDLAGIERRIKARQDAAHTQAYFIRDLPSDDPQFKKAMANIDGLQAEISILQEMKDRALGGTGDGTTPAGPMGKYETAVSDFLAQTNKRIEANRKLAESEIEIAQRTTASSEETSKQAKALEKAQKAMEKAEKAGRDYIASLNQELLFLQMENDGRQSQIPLLQAEIEMRSRLGRELLPLEHQQLQQIISDMEYEKSLMESRQEITGILDFLKTEEEAIKESYARRQMVIEMGLERKQISEAAAVDALIKLNAKEMEELTALSRRSTDQLTKFVEQAAENIQNAMSDTFFDWMQGKFSDLGTQFKQMLDRMVANALAAKLNEAIFGPGFGTTTSKVGGWAGKLIPMLTSFLPGGGGAAAAGATTSAASYAFDTAAFNPSMLLKRAEGGRVIPGMPYIVGEKRPEVFMPDSSGTILPSLGGGVTVAINVYGITDGRGIRESAGQLAAKAGRTVQGAMSRNT